MLSRALSSVRSQLRRPDRIIVVVDASEDVLNRVGQFREQRSVASGEQQLPDVEVIGGHGQRGVSAARNLGAILAPRGLLAFLDDDDAWKPDYLSEVVSEGYGFGVALAGFEKHTASTVAAEKIPPPTLTAEAFRVANPGLRGSNIVIDRDLYLAIGGFDETLPAFNDLDFGIRLARADPSYRQITKPLVEFHSHHGPRLSTPGCQANREGLRRYLEIHGADMSASELAAFRDRALRLWGIDPLASEAR